MTWLTKILKWLAALLIHETVEQVKTEIKKPSTIEDEKVPQPLADALQRDLAAKLRDKNGGR